MSHIRKTPSGKFEVRYRAPDGQERSRRFTARRDAQAFIDRVGVERQSGTWRDPRASRMLLQDWVATWQPTVVGLRPSSLARDDAYIRTHLLPRFGRMPIGAITTLDVRAWVADLSAAGLAPATVHKAYQTLSKLLRAAVENDLLTVSPCRRTPLPRVDRQEMRYLNPAEVARLADSITARYRAFVVFDAYCGLRLSELAGLRRRHIDLIERRVRVTENAVEVKGRIEWGQPKTRAGLRTVPMTVKVSAALAQHLDEFVGPDPASLVFGGADGGVLRAGSFRSRFWAPATKKADLVGLRIHDLRHTAVALWIAAGANPKQLATWAGHTSVSVVLDRYGHLYDGHDVDILDRLDQLADRLQLSPTTPTG